MTLESLIMLTVKGSIILNVIVIGLSATLDDALFLFRRPAKLAKAFLAMNVVMPVFAVLLVLMFDLHQAVKIALLTLSLSPVPPVFPNQASKAGGREGYTIGLLVAMALIAMVYVPVTLAGLGRVLSVDLGSVARAIGLLLFQTVLAPLAVGIALRALGPAFVDRILSPLSKVALLLLAAGVLPILFAAFPAIKALIGNGTLLALVAFVAVGHVAGHWLGGPNADDRAVLAIATALRHPGVALALAAANVPEQKLTMAAVLLFMLVNVAVNLPYAYWVKRRNHPALAVGQVGAAQPR